DAGEELALHDGEKFVVGCPQLLCVHRPRASFIFCTNCRARCVMEAKSPVLAPAVRLPPAPTATAPALIHSATFSMLTPPVGMSCACGSGPFTAFTNEGPRISPGKTLTMSAPHSIA